MIKFGNKCDGCGIRISHGQSHKREVWSNKLLCETCYRTKLADKQAKKSKG